MASPMALPSLIAWWGAGLSTLLALIKLWELWRDRFQVDVSANLVGVPEIGNKVLIRNLSSRSIILSDWSLYYSSGSWPRRRRKYFANPEYDFEDITIRPYSTCTLTFADQNYFSWGADLAGKSIRIELRIVGRRTIDRMIYRA